MPTTVKLEKGYKVKPNEDIKESAFYKLVQEYLGTIEAIEGDVLRNSSPWAREYALKVGESDYGVSLLINLEMAEDEDPVLTLEAAIGKIEEGTDVEELQKRISYLNLSTKQFPVSYGLNPHNQVIVRFSVCGCGGIDTARFVFSNFVGLSLSALRCIKKDCDVKPFFSKEEEKRQEASLGPCA